MLMKMLNKKKLINWILTDKTYLKPIEWKKFFKFAQYKVDYTWTILKT